MKKIKLVILLTALVVTIVVGINIWISSQAKDLMYDDVLKIPKNKVGLVLGTRKKLANGQINLYYQYRIEATLKLYHTNKIEFILISGDNSKETYNEPLDIKKDLIKNGIPENKIFLDYAGFRTLDSVIRAKEIFGLSELTFISQKFHNERAIYLSKNYNINAIAFNARDVNYKYGFKTQTREYLSKTKAFVDLLLNVKPKFLGDKIKIE